MSVVSLSTVKEYLPELSGTGADTALTNLIDRVESAVARYLGYPAFDGSLNPQLDQATYTVYVDGPTTYDFFTLQLPVAPIVSITSIHTDSNRQYTSGTLIDSSHYTFNAQHGRIYLDPNTTNRNFVTGYRANKVVCTVGYTSLTAPDDLEHAVCIWVSQLHRNKANQGKESITQTNATVRISPKTMPAEVKEYLSYLKNVGVFL